MPVNSRNCRWALTAILGYWTPHSPCCLANAWLDPRSAPSDDVACVQRLSKPAMMEFKAFIETPGLERYMEWHAKANRRWMRILHPELYNFAHARGPRGPRSEYYEGPQPGHPSNLYRVFVI